MSLSIKIANPDQEFEQGFFQLAYDKLQARLFNLLPFLVGFEVVRKTDNGAKAVGVFGFKSQNGQILFVPAFFVNGKVKDLDTLYSRNNNQFYPLNEDFAELFLKDDATGMGAASQDDRRSLMADIPPKNFREILQPPITERIAYAEAHPDYIPGMLKKAGIAIPSFLDFITSKTKEAHTTLIEYITNSENHIKEAFWQLLEKDGDYTDAVRRFYSDAEIASALTPKRAAVVPFKEAALSVVTLDTILKTSAIAEVNKKEIFERGYAIIDKRAEEEKSKVGLVKYTEKFSNPIDSGFYVYVTEMGLLRHGLVLVKPMLLFSGFVSNSALVLDLDAEKKGQTYTAELSKVFVKDQYKIKDYSKVHSMMEDIAEAFPSFSDTYILINESLRCTQPFRILENAKDHNGIRRVKVEPEWSDCQMCRPAGNSLDKDSPPMAVTMVFTKRLGNELEFKNNFIYVPKGFKSLKINTTISYTSYSSNASDEDRKKDQEEAARVKAGKPGPLCCVLAALSEQSILPLTVHNNGSEYFVDVAGAKSKYDSAKLAKIGMVMDFGLAEKSAEALIDKIVPGFSKEGWIKLSVTGDFQHTLVDESPRTDAMGNQVYYGQPYQRTAPSTDGYAGDPTALGLGVKPDVEGIESNIQKATAMASAGQKEIFDTQSIATLAKYSDPANKVVEYIPNFVSSLDKLGRILFMIYWETEKFQKMYGRDELPELIELVKSVFKNLGDLIIFMKRKVPDLSINNNEQAMDQI